METSYILSLSPKIALQSLSIIENDDIMFSCIDGRNTGVRF